MKYPGYKRYPELRFECPKDLRDTFNEACERQGLKRSWVLRKLITDYIEKATR